MLHWIVIAVGIALIAGLLGFRGIAAASLGIAEVLIFVLVVLVVVGLVAVLATGMV